MPETKWTMNEKLLAYFKEYRSDLPAGLVVFLVALPLCLGIALASGASLMSGIITGIVGGIVVGLLSGSQLSVSGPAAGLTVIVLGAIQELGAFELFLTAVVLAGIFQLILGFLRAGLIGLYFPSSVITGMLSAIGILLIMKQLPHFLGIDGGDFGEIDLAHLTGDHSGPLLASMPIFQNGAAIIGISALLLMIFWERPFIQSRPAFKLIPGALLAVLLGVILQLIFVQWFPQLALAPAYLVNLPDLSEAGALSSFFVFPDFSGLTNPVVWRVAAVVAIIASLETLLSIDAVIKLDPLKRHVPLNRELKAQGLGNLISGLIGGLPMTAVIVRSSANVHAGAKTKLSVVYHGLLLLICVVAIPNVLNLIPLSALAAVLLMVGYKLAKPALFVKQYRLGWNQFLPFIITIVAILATDLLVGILVGLGVGMFFILRANYQKPFTFYSGRRPGTNDDVAIIILSDHVSFLNKASLQLKLDQLKDGTLVFIDGSNCHEIDHDALVIIQEFIASAPSRNIDVQVINLLGLSSEREPAIPYAVAARLNGLEPKALKEIAV